MSVYGTGTLAYPAAFLGSFFRKIGSAVASPPPLPVGVIPPSLRPRGLRFGGAGILNLPSIGFAHRLHLRSRLTPGGRTFPGKPWAYGVQESCLDYRYSCLHSHSRRLHRNFHSDFNAAGTLPYPPSYDGAGASVPCLSPIIFGAESLDESAITHCLNGGCL